MLLSVIMAVYNGEKYIKEAIDSVLNQSFTDFEFIIVNDGSTDGTVSILANYTDKRIQVIHQQNAGLSKSLNKGISMAKGKYIARMDDDDKCHTDRLTKQLEYLLANSGIALVGSNANIIDEEGNFLYTSQLPTNVTSSEIFYESSPFFHSSVVFKKEVFNQCGGYPEDIIHHFEDILLWKRMFDYGKMANLNEPLIDYRITPDSITNKTGKAFILQKKIINTYMKGDGINAEDYCKLIAMTRLSANKKLSMYHNRIAKIYLLMHRNKKKALLHIRRSFKNVPLNISAIKLLIYSFFISKAFKNQNIQ